MYKKSSEHTANTADPALLSETKMHHSIQPMPSGPAPLAVLLALTFVIGGCGHTVGKVEVASRATAEFACDPTSIYVQTIARNHYRAAGCGKGAVFICRDGACERDSEVLPIGNDARIVGDGHRAHQVFNARRDAVLTCTRGTSLRLEAAFDSEGHPSSMEVDDGHLTIHQKACVNQALDRIELGGRPEFPFDMKHVFSP